MRKVIFSLFLVLAVSVLIVSPRVFGDATVTSATKARAAAMDKGLESVVGVGDVSSGNTQEVDGRGAASVLEYPKTITSSTGSTLNTGTALYTGACRLSTVTCSGPTTSAGDYVLLYDAAAATGTPKIECSVGVAKDTNHIIIPGGASFSTGIFADSNADSVHVSVTYDY